MNTTCGIMEIAGGKMFAESSSLETTAVYQVCILF